MKAFLFKYVLGLFIWIGKSFLNKDGSVSSRRLLAFSIFHTCYLVGRLVFIFRIRDPQYQLYGFVTDALFILVLYGIVNITDLATLKNNLNIKTEKDENK